MILLSGSEGPDQIAQMRRLIWAVAVRIYANTRFRTARPNYLRRGFRECQSRLSKCMDFGGFNGFWGTNRPRKKNQTFCFVQKKGNFLSIVFRPLVMIFDLCRVSKYKKGLFSYTRW